MDRSLPPFSFHRRSPDLPGPRHPWTVRLALWSAHHRWPVMIAWFAVTIGLFVASQSLGGIRAVSAMSGTELSQTEAGRAIAAMHAGGAESLPDRQPRAEADCDTILPSSCCPMALERASPARGCTDRYLCVIALPPFRSGT